MFNRASSTLEQPASSIIDASSGRTLSGAELRSTLRRVGSAYGALPPGPVFALTANTIGSVLRYLAALGAGRPIALLDPRLPEETLHELVARFEPTAVVGTHEPAAAGVLAPPAGYRASHIDRIGPSWRRLAPLAYPPHRDLALLLATSGSTGTPRLVRLSRGAVLANAAAIVEALDIHQGDVAATNLPIFYSYGLSVLNSHLAAGATVVVTDADALSRHLWDAVRTYGVTTFAGVPQHYEMLLRIRWNPASQPSLRTLTQAGGAMRPGLTRRLYQQIDAIGGRLYVMYGQTEATARISVLPPHRLADKLGSAGLPVPGGSLEIAGAARSGTTGEVIYRGPNVMQGYADHAGDLTRGSELGGELATGDIGYLDADGFLYLTGRLKRIGKVFGVRVSLDEVEQVVGGGAAAVAVADRVVVWCPAVTAESSPVVAARLAERLRAHHSGFDVREIERLPVLASGKVDYASLAAWAAR